MNHEIRKSTNQSDDQQSQLASDTILIVDDQPANVYLLKHILENKQCYQVLTATSGIEAMGIIKKQNIDLLLTDIVMPEIDGIELIKKAKKQQSNLLCICVTAGDDTETAISALNAGAFAYILKPYNNDEIFNWVDSAFEGLRLSKQLKIQQERTIRAELQAQNGKMAALGEMASSMAHEINQPLNVISIIVQGWELLAQRGSINQEKILQDVGMVRTNMDRISKLIDHVRILGHRSEETSEVDMEQIINSVLELCMVQFKNHAIEVHTTFAENIPKVVAIASELEQVFLNLLGNARYVLDARPRSDNNYSPRIEIRVSSTAGKVTASVKDNGGGISPRIVDRVFEPYFSTKPIGEGTGIGLSISRGIIDKFGGELSLNNQPGQGAEFLVTMKAVGVEQE